MQDDFVTKSGMRLSDVMLLEYCTYGSYPNPPNGYPQVWESSYGITDVNAVLSSLEERGYIRFKTAKEMLPMLTVPQLKAAAAAVGVSAKGKKADLIFALSNVPDSELEQAIPNRKYRLTEKGDAAHKANAHVIFAVQHTGINVSPERMEELVAENPKIPFRDLIWGELNSRVDKYMYSRAWGFCRNNCLSMFYLVYGEHRYDVAFSQLVEIFYYDVNSKSPMIAPGIVELMQNCAERLSLTEEETFERAKRLTVGTAAERDYVDGIDVAGIIALLVAKRYEFARAVLKQYPEVDQSFFEKLR